MTFQIHALPTEDFEHLFTLSDSELKGLNAVRMEVTESPGFPCRVSLKDAAVGETVILTNFEHQPALSPYKSSHAIFVRENAKQSRLNVDEIPKVLSRRLLSVRGFDATHNMVAADVIKGQDLAEAISAQFETDTVAYLHIHNAKPGCYAARVTRA